MGGRDVVMKKRTVTKPVEGGVTRDAASGRFVAVRTERGGSKSTGQSRASIEEASSRHNAALKRLADR